MIQISWIKRLKYFRTCSLSLRPCLRSSGATRYQSQQWTSLVNPWPKKIHVFLSKHSLHGRRVTIGRMEITLQVTIHAILKTIHLTFKQVYCTSSLVQAVSQTLTSSWTIWEHRTSKYMSSNS